MIIFYDKIEKKFFTKTLALEALNGMTTFLSEGDLGCSFDIHPIEVSEGKEITPDYKKRYNLTWDEK